MKSQRKSYIDSMMDGYIEDIKRERKPLSKRAMDFFLPEKKVEKKEEERKEEKPAEPAEPTDKELEELEKAEEEELEVKKDFFQNIRAFFFPARVKAEEEADKEQQERITKLVLYRDISDAEVKFLLALLGTLLSKAYRRTREEFKASDDWKAYQKIRERYYSGDESS